MMEEEGGEEDTYRVYWENNKKKKIQIYIPPDPQDDVNDRADSNVNISKFLTESDSTRLDVQPVESKESYSGKDNEEGCL